MYNFRTYHSYLYTDFLEIEKSDYYRVILFFEKKESDVKELVFEEQFHIHIAYVLALFEVGRKQRFLQYVDHLLEQSIIYNIQFFEGEDIYEKLLFKKGACLYRLGEYKSAEKVVTALIKINPTILIYQKLLHQILLQKNSIIKDRFIATGIILFILSVIISAIEIIVIRPFYGQYIDYSELSRWSIFIVSILCIFLGFIIHHYIVFRKIKTLIK